MKRSSRKRSTNARNAGTDTEPTVVSLFAGCGGSSLGYKWAGFRELLAAEWDGRAIATFRLNFPKVPIYTEDIRKLTGPKCRDLAGIERGALDVLDASPPCQGFSSAGKRKLSDPGNLLGWEFLRLVRELQPRCFIMENVLGLARGIMKPVYLALIADLRAAGYRAKGAILNAQYFGVPQSRQRVIICGVRLDMDRDPSFPKPIMRPILLRDCLPYDPAIKGFITASNERHAVRGRGYLRRWDQVAPTLIAKGNSKMDWSGRVHRLSVQESRIIASFPSEWRWAGYKTNIIAQIGNAVPPKLMEAIARHVRAEILTPSPCRPRGP